MKVPCLREIAKECRVNVSTVSRALNHSSKIPVVTQQRILAQAQLMGWRPNPLASAYQAHLRSTRTPSHQANLAFVISFTDSRRLEDLPAYHRQVFQGARQRASALGYILIPVWLHEAGFQMKRLSHILRHRGVSGIVLHGGNLPEGAFRKMDWKAFAVATWGFSIKNPDMHRAAHNMSHGIRQALEKILARGYRRPALMLSRIQDDLSDHAALAFFHYELRQSGVSPLVYTYDPSRPQLHGEIQTWIRQNKPDVIIGDEPVWKALEEMRWSVPGRVAFVSLFWHEKWPHIAGIDQRPDIIGSHVIDLISSQLLRNERGLPQVPKLMYHDGTWNEGPSLPEQNRKSGKIRRQAMPAIEVFSHQPATGDSKVTGNARRVRKRS